MKKILKISLFLFLAFNLYWAAKPALAHEAYVLTREQFQQGLQQTSFQAFSALNNPGNLKTFLTIVFWVFLLLAVNFFFRRSATGRKISSKLESFSRFGPIIVRLAFFASFFYSALSWSFLGPELSLANLPFANILRIAIFAISGLVLFGLFTEVAAAAAIIIYSLAFYKYGLYLVTYFNYLGEIIVLILFGSRFWSLDRLIFGASRRLAWLKKYQTSIVRIFYGIALSYAAITIKFLHPILTITVVKQYGLTRFHWLFPHDPLLVTFGAALAELIIGLFIIFGFELRLTVLISLFYITLSLIYFRELVWPHLMLYGISLSLLLEPETLTLDNFFSNRFFPNRVRKTDSLGN